MQQRGCSDKAESVSAKACVLRFRAMGMAMNNSKARDARSAKGDRSAHRKRHRQTKHDERSSSG